METELKAVEKELKAERQEKDRLVNNYKADLINKQEEHDTVKERLI
jgi:hypothetical protein